MVKTFKDLILWQKAHQLALKIYQYTKKFPHEEKYGLTAQMRRSATSIPTNIVEGYKRKGYRDALNFFNISDASLSELTYQTLLAFDLGYIDEKTSKELEELEQEVGKILNSWQKNYYCRTAGL